MSLHQKCMCTTVTLFPKQSLNKGTNMCLNFWGWFQVFVCVLLGFFFHVVRFEVLLKPGNPG